MMIECELCHEWYVDRPSFAKLVCSVLTYEIRYHGKCLKVSRGKVKEGFRYTCPICDWRVRIPRDSARPKLEDLCAWQDEISSLPFQPVEEDVLSEIINNAQQFRQELSPLVNLVISNADGAETFRFYLRKLEGAEVFLGYEINFFRKELHKWAPVSPDPPPILEASKSSRKPRPTKLQRLIAQHGVDNAEMLPSALRSAGSASSGPPQIPLSQQQAEEAMAPRKSIIHLLAIEPMSEEALRAVIPNAPNIAITQTLLEVADKKEGKWELRKLFWMELDIWGYKYRSEENRRRAINNAVKVYDELKLGVSEPEWDRLVPASERGKGRILSNLPAPTKPRRRLLSGKELRGERERDKDGFVQ
jgi:hypothetical protein